MSRFSAELQFYNYKIICKQGPQNCVPDMLSRDVAVVDLQNPDPDELRAAQMEDPQWTTLINFLEGDGLPNVRLALPLNEFELNEGCVYRVSTLSDKILKQVVVPRHLQKAAIKIAHAPPLAGHPGIYRT